MYRKYDAKRCNKDLYKLLCIIVFILIVIAFGYRPVDADNIEMLGEYKKTISLGERFALIQCLPETYSDYDWSAYSSNKISIDEDGIATGLNLGITEINVYCNDGLSYYIVEVEVIIKDGVYRISDAQAGKCMQCGNDTISENNVILEDYTNNGIDYHRQLWIVNRDDDGLYTIVPYIDNTLFLMPSGSNFPVRIDSGLNNKWFLSSSNSRVRVSQPYINDSIYNCSDNNQVYFGTNGNAYCWIFEQVTNYTKAAYMLDLYDYGELVEERYITIDSSKTLDDMKMKILYCYNNIENTNCDDMFWSSQNSEVAMVNSITGEVTAVGVGSTVISLQTTLLEAPISYTIHVIDFEEGVYNIYNITCKKYLSGFENAAGDMMISTTDSSNDELTKWMVELSPNGTYKLLLIVAPPSYMYSKYALMYYSEYPEMLVSLSYANILENYLDFQWKLEATNIENVYYIFSAKKSVDFCSIQINVENDNNLRLSENYDDNKWRFIKIDESESYSHEVRVYYEKAFVEKYDNYVTIIQNGISNLISTFLECFDLGIVINGVSQYDSIADLCNNENNIEYMDDCPGKNVCNLTGNSDETCKNSYKVSKDALNNIKDDCILFCGNSYYNSGILTERSYFDYYISENERYGVIMLMDVEEKFIHTLLHEYSHMLTAPDHYHEMLTNADGTIYCRSGDYCSICGVAGFRRSKKCIMFGKQDEPIWCEDCRFDIIHNLYIENLSE